jgi:hypothetical protein
LVPQARPGSAAYAARMREVAVWALLGLAALLLVALIAHWSGRR